MRRTANRTASTRGGLSRSKSEPRKQQRTQSATDDGTRDSVGVQSLGRAFSIIEVVASARDGIGLADISRAVGLHNSTTFHLAKTLTILGYLRQDGDSKRYRIGRKLFTLAAGALDEIAMVNLATPALEALSLATGESSHFCVRAGDTVVVLARTGGSGAFQIASRVGVVRPAHCTALGKAVLASFSDEQLRAYLRRNPLTPATKRSITEIPELIREIERVRREGVAIDDGEFDLEVRCVAVAVKDYAGAVVGAIGISGPIWRMTDELLARHAKTVVSAAGHLSEAFGHRASEKGGAGTREESGAGRGNRVPSGKVPPFSD